ncbi:MAG: protein-glutamate O-methyltransferase CheR [Pseudomonadota bacterium]
MNGRSAAKALPAEHQALRNRLSDAEFDHIRQLIRSVTGISMNESKRQLVCRRLGGRIAELGMQSFAQYITLLESGNAKEVEIFSNAVTTNLTSFFRENHHFEHLSNAILPELLSHNNHDTRRLRIWSAGCSTGEEPYSIAMTLRESAINLNQWNARVLATDLDSDVLAHCRKGHYSAQTLSKVPASLRKKYFKDGPVGSADTSSKLKELIQFNQLNLMSDWPMKGKFDLIFCRNVIIYFDKSTQRQLVDRFANALADDGHLIIGHSESLLNVSQRFKLIGKTIYRKSG